MPAAQEVAIPWVPLAVMVADKISHVELPFRPFLQSDSHFLRVGNLAASH
jgi:hypothetical protein